MLDRLFNDGHQVLIFSQMTSVLNVMEDYLNWRKWNYCRIDGSTNIDERQKQMDVFNAETTGAVDGTRNLADDRHFVFLLSTRAGGLGINLTAADTCIIFDSDWNPHADSQAMDRTYTYNHSLVCLGEVLLRIAHTCAPYLLLLSGCHRLGQTRPVAVYRLITINSVDIEMMEKQMSKKKLERMTIAGGDFRKAGRRSNGDITFDHLQNLLQSDVKDLNAKGGDVENIAISQEEFDDIMDRKKLFISGKNAIQTEGKMYDLIDAVSSDVLGAMNTENQAK
jgi:ATP-dependent DNA helicase